MRRFKIIDIVWIGLIVVLAAATFFEKYRGTAAAHDHIYGAWWFAGLWAVLAGCSLAGMWRQKMFRNVPLCALHLSLIVILAGALTTKLWGERGRITLPESGEATVEGLVLPFDVSLDSFEVEYYAGTKTPADYVSEVTVSDPASGAKHRGRVSMNNIFSYRGYRFYQSSFAPDETASVLSINHDPAGIAITYAGYGLFVLSGLMMMLRRMSFKKRKGAAVVAVMLALIAGTATVRGATTASADMPEPGLQTPDGLTVNEAQAREFGRLWMLYEGKITSVSVFAHDFTMKLTGKSKFSYMNAEQFLAGFLFFPEKWQNVALFRIKDPELKKLLNAETQPASFDDFFDREGNYKPAALPRTKEIDKLNDKIQLINLLHGGSLLALFPLPQEGSIHWYSPTEDFAAGEPGANVTFVRTVLSDYYTALRDGDESSALAVLQRIGDFQKQHAGPFLPSDAHRRAGFAYLMYNVVPLLFKINLTAGIVAFLSVFALRNERRRRLAARVLLGVMGCSFICLTASVALRTYIGGRLPFATGSEVMLLLAWTAMLGAWIFRRKSPLVAPFGAVVSGCALLVAHLGMVNPKITPLMPVLSSPLLSLHVSVIMISYVLLAFTALNGIAALATAVTRGDNKAALERAREGSLMCLRPALYFLGTGIFIGAVWANVSWGAYWSWDPKEVWALITFLTYGYALHKRDFSPLAFHVFVTAAFATVLITYFGVNWFFGGMHGYN